MNYHTLYALEKDFNAVGLTIQVTEQNWMALCKVVNGSIVAERVLEDFLFLGRIEDKHLEISPRALDVLVDFVSNKASVPSIVQNCERVWRSGVCIYDKAISIMHEDVNRVAQMID